MAVFGQLLAPISAPVGLILVFATLILFASDCIKSSIVSIASFAVMLFWGFIMPAEFAGGFSNSGTILVVGITVVGTAIAEIGCVEYIGKKILSVSKLDEKGQYVSCFHLVSSQNAPLAAMRAGDRT